MAAPSELESTVTFPTEREIVVTRVVKAPPRLVWKAWTRPELLARWWGPFGFSTTTREFEFRPGGHWRFVMHGPDGRDYQNEITYAEIVEPRRLTYKHGGTLECGPLDFAVTVTFDPVEGDRTRITLRSVFASQEARDFVLREHGAAEGGRQTLARLDEFVASLADAGTHAPGTRITLPSDTELTMTRTFAAPRERVFAAWTRPELLRRWWGPPGWALPVCEIDLRPGGAWRFVMRNQRGTEMSLSGRYVEVTPPERLVQTQRMEGCDGQGAAEALCTLTLHERDGLTVMTSTAKYPSKAIRDSVLSHGTTEEGMDLVFDRLDELLVR